MITYKKNDGKSALVISTMWLEYVVLLYFLAKFILPGFIEWASLFFIPFSSVLLFLYTATLIISCIFGLIGMWAIYMMTYSKKFDDPTKEPGVPDIIPLWKYLLNTVKSIAIISLAFYFKENYISIICTILLFYSAFYRFIQKDFMAKMLKLKLAFRE